MFSTVDAKVSRNVSEPCTVQRPFTFRVSSLTPHLFISHPLYFRRPRWAFTILDETMQRWCFAPDMETFEHAGLEAVNRFIGPVSEAIFSTCLVLLIHQCAGM